MTPKKETDHQISVMVVDDHDVVRQGVKLFLDMQPDITVVAEASSGKQAIEQAQETLPDVVLMDLIMPEMTGVEATRFIRDLCPNTQVIVLTSYHTDEHIFPAVQAGALSYLLKDVDAEELADAVRKAHRHEAVLHPKVAERVIQELEGTRLDQASPYQLLSERELQVLKLVAKGKANAEIAEQLFVSIKTVRAHVSNILSKLHLKDRTQVAVFAWQKGMVDGDG